MPIIITTAYKQKTKELGDVWLTDSVHANWSAIRSSQDGQKLIAAAWSVDPYFGIKVSIDRGVTWSSVGAAMEMRSCAISADGSTWLAGPANSFLRKSTNNGSTWIQLYGADSGYWRGLDMSSDGSKMMGIQYSTGKIQTSRDGGVSWSTIVLSEDLTSCACSQDGKIMIVTTANVMYISNDYGVTFVPQNSSTLGMSRVVCNSDGSVIYAVSAASLGASRPYISTNYGNTWIAATSPSNSGLFCISCTDNGNILVASDGGYVYISRNRGLNWTRLTIPARTEVISVCDISGNGNLMAYADNKIRVSNSG